ncbi:MAG: DNA repair protein RecO [Elusimicrobiota bacterium]|jgi:DNA repair protein RecO (recombination protein O)|nr:DNA repair protein RecO [Elusimicrobiota bacterium]
MYYQIKGLVLNSQISGEADKVANIFSYQWGKISVLFTSAKKIKAKLAAVAEPLTESEFMLYQSHPSMRPKAVGGQILNNFSPIKLDFTKNIYAFYTCEIVLNMVAYNVSNIKKYELIRRIWQVLGDCKNPKRATMAFVLRFLILSGYSFGEYIANNLSVFDAHLQREIAALSRCAGNNLDSLNIDDKRVWLAMETYLSAYMKKPAVGIFLKKMESL